MQMKNKSLLQDSHQDLWNNLVFIPPLKKKNNKNILGEEWMCGRKGISYVFQSYDSKQRLNKVDVIIPNYRFCSTINKFFVKMLLNYFCHNLKPLFLLKKIVFSCRSLFQIFRLQYFHIILFFLFSIGFRFCFQVFLVLK